MQNTNGVLALMAFGLVFQLASPAALRAQESEQPIPVAMASTMSGISGSLVESPDGAIGENGAPGDAVPAGHGACWQQAGLSKAVMEQRRSIVSGAKEQIRSVESDSTLTLAEQKRQIRQIRVNARQNLGK